MTLLVHASRLLSHGNRKYSLNEKFFDTWTNESAYWLGFLYADGCVRQDKLEIVVGLKCTDYKHLHKMLYAMDANNPVTYRAQQKSLYCRSKIGIGSKRLGNKLCKLGCHPNKSLTLKWSNAVPNKYYREFIRGYFDGDGCIHWIKRHCCVSVSFTGTESMLAGIFDTIKQRACPTYKGTVRATSSIYQLNFSGNAM
eukprot:717109_1